MKKNYFLLLFFIGIKSIFAQVGINTTTPNAQLEIKSSDQAAPSNTDGILIPKVDVFPATNPTAAQQGMLVYLTTTTGTNLPGFYYWDNSVTPSWKPITGTNIGTLDQAYDFGGAGNGKIITADAGAVTINGTDGFVSTGTIGTGLVAPSGAGVKMFWNPRKAAFRAGRVLGTHWDDVNIGQYSTAFGYGTIASGDYSTAFGVTNASGDYSTAFGVTTAFGDFSTTFGSKNTSRSYAETVFGIGATDFMPSTNGDTQFRTANSSDRLFVIGNAIDTNNNNTVDTSERSDALIILKNGLTRLPSTTNAMINAADGKAVVTREYLQNTTGTLDQAYDFGGAGNGKTITADAGAVTIDGTDGFVSRGTAGVGAIMPSGSGTRMVWNPRKAAFRAGQASGTSWDDVNVGDNSVAMGFGTKAIGNSCIALGSNSSALGFGSVAIGWSANANATQSTAFGLATNANSLYSTAFGYSTTTRGNASVAIGVNNETKSYGETALGIGATTYTSSTNGDIQFRSANATDRLLVVGNAIDVNNNDAVDTTERSDALIILKNGLTRLPSTTNAMINAADGKAVVTKEYLLSNNTAWGLTGNSGTTTTTNFIGTTDNVDIVFKRNNIRAGLLGTTNTSFGLNTLVNNTGVDNSAIGNNALENNTTGDYNTANGESALKNNTTGNENTASGSNALLSTTTGSFNTANGKNALLLNTTGSFNTATGKNALLSTTTGSNNTANGSFSLYLNTTGINNTATGFEALRDNTTGNNNIAIGFQSLAENNNGINNVAMGVLALDANTIGNDNTAIGRGSLTDNVIGNSNTAIGKDALFNSTSNNNTAVGRGTLSGVTTGDNNTAIGFNAQVANASGDNQVRIGNASVANASVQVSWTITSDNRWKSNIQKSNLGLDFIKQLNPVFYTRKDVEVNEEKTTILETTTNPTTEYGFIAQELEATLNKFDTTNNGIITKDDAGMLGVRYNDLLAPMVKAIQEQQVIIEELKAKIEALEKK